MYGLFLVDSTSSPQAHSTSSGQAVTIEIDVVHEAPETESKIILRGLVTGRAAVNVHGNVLIKKGARGTNTHFEAKALLLSPQARCEIVPALEIDENQVRASHSTYVGKLDEEELFYLQSRGIARETAESMLIRSFLNPVTRMFSDKQLQEFLIPKIQFPINFQ